jgi:serine/threonine protein kinase
VRWSPRIKKDQVHVLRLCLISDPEVRPILFSLLHHDWTGLPLLETCDADADHIKNNPSLRFCFVLPIPKTIACVWTLPVALESPHRCSPMSSSPSLLCDRIKMAQGTEICLLCLPLLRIDYTQWHVGPLIWLTQISSWRPALSVCKSQCTLPFLQLPRLIFRSKRPLLLPYFRVQCFLCSQSQTLTLLRLATSFA